MAPIDRISGLPDDVICNILSFLPIKLSVSTSILSRRWRFLWANVPNLDFDGNNHHSNMRYWSIIDNVILPHNMQSITTFNLRLSFGGGGPIENEPEIEKLLASAVERNVQNICLGLDLFQRLPQSFLTCRTLVDLRLDNIIGLRVEVVVYFPILKVLHLCSIEYETSEALPNLVSGCPVLEELMVFRIVDYDLDCCYISSPTIKKLEIDFPFDDGDEYNLYDEVKIDAPALEYLNVLDCSYDHITLSPLTSLIEANIYFDNETLQVDYYFYTRCVLKFIDALRNVKCLKLSGGSKEFLELGVARPRVRFDNLIRLELTVDWRFILKFLESANNLEDLIIYEVDEELKIWMDPIEKQHACLLFSLRTVTIDQFGCAEHELNLVRYLLSNARVLKKIEIYYKPDGLSLEEKFHAFNKISSFHQGSAGCEIVWAEASFQQEPEEFE